MAKFFVPHAENDQQAEKVWGGVKKNMEDQGFEVSDRRIYSISYTHNGKHLVATVGEQDGYGDGEVLVLLESSSVYLCCTPQRGVVRGGPILIGKDTGTTVTDFE